MLTQKKRFGITMGVVAVPLLAIIAVVPALILHHDDKSSEHGALAQALGDIPAEATSIEFVDRTAVIKTYHLPDLRTGATSAEVAEFAKKEIAAGQVPLTDLDQYDAQMRDAAVSAFDVEWSASVSLESTGVGDIYRIRDGLDLDHVATAMAKAGFKETKVDGGVELTSSLTDMVGGSYPQAAMRDVTLLPSDHLMITGTPALAQEVRATAGSKNSVADGGLLNGLVSGEPLAASLEEADCDAVFAQMTPAQQESVRSRGGLDGLGTPRTEAVAITGATTAVASLRFTDDDAATADARARATYLAHGTSVIADEPVSDLVSDAHVSTHGSIVKVSFAPAKGRSVTTALQFLERGPDGPLACGVA